MNNRTHTINQYINILLSSWRQRIQVTPERSERPGPRCVCPLNFVHCQESRPATVDNAPNHYNNTSMVRVKTRWILARLDFAEDLGDVGLSTKHDDVTQFPTRKEVFSAVSQSHLQNFGLAATAAAQAIQGRRESRCWWSNTDDSTCRWEF